MPRDPEQMHFRRRRWDGMRPEERVSNQVRRGPTWPDGADPASSLRSAPLHPPAPRSSSSLRGRCQRLCHPSSLAPPHMPAVPTVRGRRLSPGPDPGGQTKPMPQSYQSSSPTAADAEAAMSSPAHSRNRKCSRGSRRRKVKGGGREAWRPFLGNRGLWVLTGS